MPTTRKRTRRLWIAGGAFVVVLAAAVAWSVLLAQEAPGPVEAQALRQGATLDLWAAASEGSIALATVRADLIAERGWERVGPRMEYVEDKLEAAFEAARSTWPEAPPASLEESWAEIQAALDTLTEQVDAADPAASATVAALNASLRAIGP